jgi:hypothetical protein
MRESVLVTSPRRMNAGIMRTDVYSKTVIGWRSLVVIFLSVEARLKRSGASHMSRIWKIEH